ncbi:MAG: hypothetical protein ACE5KO_00965 [Candidatus Bathyarchaeia archaeon]
MEEEEQLKSPRSTAKFMRIPLIIHTVLRRDDGYGLQIEHLQVKRTSISLPKNIITSKPEEIGDYIKEIYPEAKSFVIQYEKKGDDSSPFCAQLFLSKKGE